MQDFLDLQGASGASYRFRVWPVGAAHLPAAGNYVVVKAVAAGIKVIIAGASRDLSQVRASLTAAARRKDAHLYTRLNISRLPRLAEHEDIVAHYRPAVVIDEAV
jgi:hypothetical protein